jgi:hypothetical protein
LAFMIASLKAAYMASARSVSMYEKERLTERV